MVKRHFENSRTENLIIDRKLLIAKKMSVGMRDLCRNLSSRLKCLLSITLFMVIKMTTKDQYYKYITIVDDASRVVTELL